MSEPTPNWYALFVRSRHEFVTSEQLKKRGIEVFLPSVTRKRRWSDRKKAIVCPLFPGYLFIYTEPSAETFLNILQTRGSVSFVGQEPGRPSPVDPGEMETLRMMLAGCDELDTYPHLNEGAPVLVKQGPLKGAKGILAKKEDHHLFLVNIEILGRSVGTKVSAEDLELI